MNRKMSSDDRRRARTCTVDNAQHAMQTVHLHAKPKVFGHVELCT